MKCDILKFYLLVKQLLMHLQCDSFFACFLLLDINFGVVNQ